MGLVDKELSAFIAGFMDGIRHYSWWTNVQPRQEVVGHLKVPVDTALMRAEEHVEYYYKCYQEREVLKRGIKHSTTD